MPYPVIGLTTYRNLSEQGYPRFSVSEAYTTSLVSAGACPVMIPLGLSEDYLPHLIRNLDGLLFTGGGDIAPERFGETAHPLADEIDEDRDRQEFELISLAIEKAIPFFGICRGLQIINVALGGDLFIDILDQSPNAIKHQYYPDYPRDYLAHNVEFVGSSRMSSFFTERRVSVNSLHHQGVRNLAPDLKPVAFSPDGIIEAIELPNHPFGMAVQWHPENLQKIPSMRELFKQFVNSAALYRGA